MLLPFEKPLLIMAVQQTVFTYVTGMVIKLTYTFVNVGGEYGTQAITSNRGMRLTITGNRGQGGNNYSSCTIKGSLNNPGAGSYLGVEPSSSSHTDRVSMDRGAGDSQDLYYHWDITYGGTSSGKSYYNIKNTQTGSYLSTETAENTLRIVSSNTDKWLFIPRKAFRDVLFSVTHQTNIEVSGLFQNTRFVRYMDENASLHGIGIQLAELHLEHSYQKML